jgi:hypothetical protein
MQHEDNKNYLLSDNLNLNLGDRDKSKILV